MCNPIRIAILLCAGFLLTGCKTDPQNIDPFENFNRAMYDFNDGLDRFAIKPAADVYEAVFPEPIRTGIGNGFANLGYANVFLNDFLQGDFDRGLRNASRMAINSTIGIAGIFDVAADLGLSAQNNDFGITLGKWGVEPGPYLVLPLLGPSTTRDALGIGTVIITNPIFWLAPGIEVTLPLSATRIVDARSRFDAMFRFRDEAAIDPYIFTRDAYLQFRRVQIAPQGSPTMTRPPSTVDEDFYDDAMDGDDEVPSAPPVNTIHER